jgi:hypothetical protein
MNKFINEILEKDFTSEQKAEAFDSIARLYYDHNFGTASKFLN